ncbi:tyrosine-type recombinase/integrase [Achromobacter marplatensis]|uniref:tyrosine-type recombinase/integrase n=1 Tax=Achromobacter marplatensis TaxID=470868 RepID=UPI003C786EAA
MPENLLTDLKVRSAKSTDRDWKLSDGGGLFLLVKATGGKLWRWKYRLQGKENLFAIGGFPQVGLAEARAAREKARALVKQGILPAHERQQVKQRNLEVLEERKRAKESSFAKVAQAYLAEIKPVFALSSYRTKESRIRKYLSSKFDGMPMSDIGVKQIRPLLEECKVHGAWAAIHVKGDLSAIFEFAVVRGAGRGKSNSQPARAATRAVQREQGGDDARANPEVLSGVARLPGLSGNLVVPAADCADRLPSRGSGGCRVGRVRL